MSVEFEAFPKISRLSRDVIITEKLDGTNAQIWIDDRGLVMKVGSCNRWLTVEADNYGFYKWAVENSTDLLRLGPGRHYGEWWGNGIQRGYDLNERRFSLFNVSRWIDCHNNAGDPVYGTDMAPICCYVVPVMWMSDFNTNKINGCMDLLKDKGSFAAPGYMKPEGIIIFHTQNGVLFKKTFEGDEKGKGT
jgi:hypothetical protein